MKVLFTQLPIHNNFSNSISKAKHSTTNFGARIPSDIFEKSKETKFNYEKFGFTSNDEKAVIEFCKIMKGYPDIRKTSMKDLKQLNDKYKDNPKFLNAIYSQKDAKTGSTIFHEANFIVLREINKTLAPYPELISKFYLSKNNENELPIHKVHDYPQNARLTEILNLFENDKKTIEKMLSTKNNHGTTPYEEIDYKGRRIIHQTLKDSNPAFLADLYLKHSSHCKNTKEEQQSVQGAWDLITNSDLSIEESLQLCHHFTNIAGKEYDFDSAIEYLNSLPK